MQTVAKIVATRDNKRVVVIKIVDVGQGRTIAKTIPREYMAARWAQDHLQLGDRIAGIERDLGATGLAIKITQYELFDDAFQRRLTKDHPRFTFRVALDNLVIKRKRKPVFIRLDRKYERGLHFRIMMALEKLKG